MMFGHELIVAHDLSGTDGLLLEIGSERGGGSTFILAMLAKAQGRPFVSVDIDINQTAKAMRLVVLAGKGEAMCCDGVKYVESLFVPIVAVYCDAFDIVGARTILRYGKGYEVRGQEFTEEACHSFYLNLAKAIIPNLVPDGVVCFDDTVNNKGQWQGKGAVAVPWLLENGFEILKSFTVDVTTCSGGVLLRHERL